MMIVRSLIAAATVAVAMPASAQHNGEAFIAAYDADNDGRLTRAEYDAGRDARFKTTDANGDGWISEDEYVAEYAARLEKQLLSFPRDESKKAEERQRQIRQTHVRFGVLDVDKDAKLTRAECDRIAAQSFAEQDDDKDGVVSASDAAVTAARRAAARVQ